MKRLSDRTRMIITYVLVLLALGIIVVSELKTPPGVCAQIPCELRQAMGCRPCPVVIDPTVKEESL